MKLHNTVVTLSQSHLKSTMAGALHQHIADSSIFVTPKKGVEIAVDNHLRKAPIEIDSSPGPIVEEIGDPFDDLDEILCDYANTGKEITENEIIVHVENNTSGSDSEDLDYDPKHDEVFDEMSIYLKMFLDLDDGIDSERRTQRRELRIIGKAKNQGPNKYCLYLGQQFATKEIMKGRTKKHSVETMRKLILEVGATGIPCKHVVTAIYNMSENGIGVIPEHWVHVSYRLETWAHVYSFKINPCNGREIWPVVESRTIIILHIHKPQVSMPPKKRKKSVEELASQSRLSGKLFRKAN
nr:transposase, mutator type [Tanacetum cinerariifolium]GEW80841.1 transposase, mutator type [Tanacetum cinerariifolium]